jgi:hypothetical protein
MKETAAVWEETPDPQSYSTTWKAWAQFKRAFPEAVPAAKEMADAVRKKRRGENLAAEAKRVIAEARRLINEGRIEEAKHIVGELVRLTDEAKAQLAELPSAARLRAVTD